MIDPRDMTDAQLSAAIDRAYMRSRLDDPEITREDDRTMYLPGLSMSVGDVKRGIAADRERRR